MRFTTVQPGRRQTSLSKPGNLTLRSSTWELAEATLVERTGGHSPGSARLPVIGLTRRGDLKSRLAAFEAGVDDILTLPFAPEELLARVVALVRRSYSDAVTFTPVIKLGEQHRPTHALAKLQQHQAPELRRRTSSSSIY
jgi:DNA-binding response OmpR family regulator